MNFLIMLGFENRHLFLALVFGTRVLVLECGTRVARPENTRTRTRVLTKIEAFGTRTRVVPKITSAEACSGSIKNYKYIFATNRE